MAEEDDVMLRIAFTEKQFMQQLARIEAQIQKTASAMEKKFEDANRNLSRGFTNVSDSASGFVNGIKSAERSAEVFARAIAEEERQFNQLRASVDPAFAATKRFEQAQEQAARAVKAGVVSQREADAVDTTLFGSRFASPQTLKAQ